MLPILVHAFLIISIHALEITAQRYVEHVNNCEQTIWILPASNTGAVQGVSELKQGERKRYDIPNTATQADFTPLERCNADGQSVDQCKGANVEATKVEFGFPAAHSSEKCFYDISMVDGFSKQVKVTPSPTSHECKEISCLLPLGSCPKNEIYGIGDLNVYKNNQPVQCKSPCTKANTDEACCRSAFQDPTVCRTSLAPFEYVKLVKGNCPDAYSFSNDDITSNTCPADTSFTVTWCPQ